MKSKDVKYQVWVFAWAVLYAVMRECDNVVIGVVGLLEYG